MGRLWKKFTCRGGHPSDSHAEEPPKAHTAAPSEDRFIGRGQCGAVYALVDGVRVVKAAHPGKEPQLLQDSRVHEYLQSKIAQAPKELQLPKIPTFIEYVTGSSKLRLDVWPQDPPTDSPPHVIGSQRIPPVQENMRQELIKRFCPKADRKAARAWRNNRDCLVRVYLGNGDPLVDWRRSKPDQPFSLRNLPLGPVELERLRVNTTLLAKSMADALAVMHWSAHIDGDDVEFVVGESMEMWLLDFNQCSNFEPNDDRVDWLSLLVKAFWFNDPYYPRPLSGNESNERLWKAFSNRYIETAEKLTSTRDPRLFIDAVVAEAERRQPKTEDKRSLLGALLS